MNTERIELIIGSKQKETGDLFGWSLKRCRKYVHRILCTKCSDKGFAEDTAQDLTQEILIKFWNASNDTTFITENHLKAFLRKIAHYHFIDKMRLIKSGLVVVSYQTKGFLPETRRDNKPWLPEYFDLEKEPEPDFTPQQNSILELLDDKPDWKQAFILHTFKEHSQDEIAVLMGVTPSTVRSYLFKARNRLKESKLVQEMWG